MEEAAGRMFQAGYIKAQNKIKVLVRHPALCQRGKLSLDL
jgi:hypothetical protein